MERRYCKCTLPENKKMNRLPDLKGRYSFDAASDYLSQLLPFVNNIMGSMKYNPRCQNRIHCSYDKGLI